MTEGCTSLLRMEEKCSIDVARLIGALGPWGRVGEGITVLGQENGTRPRFLWKAKVICAGPLEAFYFSNMNFANKITDVSPQIKSGICKCFNPFSWNFADVAA